MTKDQKIIRAKGGVLDSAKQLGTLSQACKMMGYGRDSFSRSTQFYATGGELAGQEISRRKRFLMSRALPEHVRTDRGAEYCGTSDRHEYELHLAVGTNAHPFSGHSTTQRLAEPLPGSARTKARSPQTNGRVERVHKTMLNEFCRIASRKKTMRPPANCKRISMSG